jgi:hypothetical protein
MSSYSVSIMGHVHRGVKRIPGLASASIHKELTGLTELDLKVTVHVPGNGEGATFSAAGPLSDNWKLSIALNKA